MSKSADWRANSMCIELLCLVPEKWHAFASVCLKYTSSLRQHKMISYSSPLCFVRSPRVLFTLSVRAEARKNTPIVNHDFQTNLLSSISHQIIARDRTVPRTIQTMHIVKQILLRCSRFMVMYLFGQNVKVDRRREACGHKN